MSKKKIVDMTDSVQDDASTDEIIKELENDIAKMKDDKEVKCKRAKEQLIEQLRITSDKYRTATGTIEGLRTLRLVAGHDGRIDLARPNALAMTMAAVAEEMRAKAETLPCNEMDKLCDGFYEKDLRFDDDNDDYLIDDAEMVLAEQLMRIDLCRNVGPAAEDMVEFIKRTQEEIDKTGEKLKELRSGAKEAE